jgi:hypothetical protein
MAVYFRHSSAGIVYTRNATEAREAGARRRQRRKQAAAEAVAVEAAEPIDQPGFVESAVAASDPHTADGALPPLRIVAKDCGAGFFALLLYAVNQLIWAEGEAKGRKSRVEFGRRCQDGRPNRYYDAAKGPNVWEYYFEPVSDAGPAANELVLDAKQQFHLHHMAPESVQTYPHGVHRHLKVPKWVYDEAWHLQVTGRRRRHIHLLLVGHHHHLHLTSSASPSCSADAIAGVAHSDRARPHPPCHPSQSRRLLCHRHPGALDFLPAPRAHGGGARGGRGGGRRRHASFARGARPRDRQDSERRRSDHQAGGVRFGRHRLSARPNDPVSPAASRPTPRSCDYSGTLRSLQSGERCTPPA